jgi:molybdate transport system permease protein
MRLIVDIQKQLASYTLAVAFEVVGETLGVLGSSGSGKSMTLRCIAGIETPTRGTIVLNDRILYDSRRGIDLPSRDRNVGYLFQHYALFPHLTVAQNIAYGLRGLAKPARQRRVGEQLTQVNLTGLGDRYPHQLSGGQQQRVALARALAPAPHLLLLDEPFSALDTHLRSELEQQLIKTLSTYAGLTLFVSHNLEEVYRVCQPLLVLSAGAIAAFGPSRLSSTTPTR